MKRYRRSLIALGVAAVLPTFIFSTLFAVSTIRSQRDAARADIRARVDRINDLVDAEIKADSRVILTIASSPNLVDGDWVDFRVRAGQFLEANTSWKGLVVTRVRDGGTEFSLWRDGSGGVAAVPPPRLVTGISAGGVAIGAGGPEVALHAPVPPALAPGASRFVLTVLKDPAVFQEALARGARQDEVAALVDRDGKFIARTVHADTRVGHPATAYVRRAIASGAMAGEYRGVTYEGLRNNTAYAVIPRVGWSTHIAYDVRRIDLPSGWAFVTASVGGLAALALATLLAVLVLRDMAERRRADEALRHAQKMEAVGQLTGGIAHDFNNLLTPIIGGLERVKSRLGPDERAHRILDNALEAARRAAKLTGQLLAFSRTQRMTIAPVDLARLVSGLSDLLAHSTGPGVRIETRVPGGLYALTDAGQLELALINLAVNARDAMPDGGVVTITATEDDDVVDLAVADTGVGMSEDVRARALEPFFTTKPTGAGTGLGLSQVFALARQSGGDVLIESAPGAGATVHVRLPRSAEAPRPAPPAPPSPFEASDGGAGPAVLVVDDDAQVRAHIVETLQAAGYDVRAAADGAAALAALDDRRADLMVVDFAMPGMNGAELVQAARARRPGQKAIIVTGYADSAALEAAAGDVRVLRKPFDVAALANAVDEALAP